MSQLALNAAEEAYLATAPPRIQSVVRNALACDQQQRRALAAQLTVNVVDPGRRQRLATGLAQKPLEELLLLAELVPGAGALPPVDNAADDVLPLPAMQFPGAHDAGS
jgi:hypothetical protein